MVGKISKNPMVSSKTYWKLLNKIRSSCSMAVTLMRAISCDPAGKCKGFRASGKTQIAPLKPLAGDQKVLRDRRARVGSFRGWITAWPLGVATPAAGPCRGTDHLSPWGLARKQVERREQA
jgi:hypothetical protein